MLSSSKKLESKSLIVRSFRRAHIAKFLSFTHGRFSKMKLATRLPEINEIDIEIGFQSLQSREREMIHHNEILRRGKYMRIHVDGGIERLTFSSLDRYILQMHSQTIANVLNALSKFADKVIPLIQRDRTAKLWQISDEILIQKQHWLALARQVMNLLKLLGFDNTRAVLDGSILPWHSPWPDFECLLVAVRRARGNYESFGIADDDYACL